jgi:hypothetical protein
VWRYGRGKLFTAEPELINLTMQVVALIHEQNGTYNASFPDFSDCTASANDSEKWLDD